LSDTKLAEGTIVERSGKWFLLFSNGREEGPFNSKASAEKREKQVQFFKNRSKGNVETASEFQEMADLGIAAEYRIDGPDEVIYLLVQDDEVVPVLAKGPEGDREITNLSEENAEEYGAILDFIFEEAEGEHETKDYSLSSAIVDSQMITTGHKHTATLDSNRDGKSSEDAGHVHNVYGGYVSSAPVEVDGVRIMHTHLLEITPSKG
jgi:hypothetical protein